MQSADYKTYEVMLPLPFNHGFTYGVKDNIRVNIGDIVLVPFGRREVLGVIWNEAKNDVEKSKLKYIISKYDCDGFSQELLSFIKWVANYTISLTGMVLKMALSDKQALLIKYESECYKILDKNAGKLTNQRKNVFDALQSGMLLKNQLKDKSQASDSVINSMVKIGFIEKILKETKQELNFKPQCVNLSKIQQNAVNEINSYIDEKPFSVSLIDGVTGSGKTEIYLSVAEKILHKQNSQTLILVPEIILTNQLIGRLKERFGFEPIKWHSNLTPKQRQLAYKQIIDGDARLIVGARSALFLPYKNLKLIIIDEEHDSSFKQEDGVMYNARNMSVVRAKFEKIPLILVSATPSLETLNNVKENKYKLVSLKERHGNASMPNIEIIDMREVKIGATRWISPILENKIKQQLSQNKQSLLFLNRRGYAPLTLCRSCGYKFQCANCSTMLVKHSYPDVLKCHHCGYVERNHDICPQCQKEDSLVACGPGVQRIEQEAKSLFGDAKIAVITSEIANKPALLNKIITQIKTNQIQIIIGTQIIAKGHNFPKLNLVGIIDADIGLAGGDLRALEKTYQLLHQVSGRAGRYNDEGEVLIQSYIPDNKVIEALKTGNRDEFFNNEIKSRKIMQMPPFGRLVALIFSGKNAKDVLNTAKNLVKVAPYDEKITILGPVEAPIFILNKKYRYRILIKTANNINIQTWLKNVVSKIKIPNSVNLKIDVDPVSFL